MSDSVDRNDRAQDAGPDVANVVGVADVENAAGVADGEVAPSPNPSLAPPAPGLAPVPVLRLVRPLAAIAVVAMILGRVLGPASTGLVVGMGRVTRAVEFLGSVATQLFAMVATVLMMAEIIAVTKSKQPAALRFASIGIGGFGVLVGLSAAAVRVPGFSSAALGIGAGLLALASSWDALRAPFARIFAFALGLIGLAGLARLASIGVATLASERASARLFELSRGTATLSFVIDACALLVTLTVLSLGRKKIMTPLTLIVLVAAFIATRQALVADAEDAGALSLLLRRAVDRLMTRPEPFVPVALRMFVSLLAVFTALAALFARGHVPALLGALSLALLARGALDMPLGAIVLILAALSMALAARDDRGVWAAITAKQLKKAQGREASSARAND